MTKITLTELQREEVAHLFHIADDESDNNEGHYLDDIVRLRNLAQGLQSLLDGELPTGNIDAVVEELEYHRDKFAPKRAGRFTPADRGEPTPFHSTNALIRKINKMRVEAEDSAVIEAHMLDDDPYDQL